MFSIQGLILQEKGVLELGQLLNQFDDRQDGNMNGDLGTL